MMNPHVVEYCNKYDLLVIISNSYPFVYYLDTLNHKFISDAYCLLFQWQTYLWQIYLLAIDIFPLVGQKSSIELKTNLFYNFNTLGFCNNTSSMGQKN